MTTLATPAFAQGEKKPFPWMRLLVVPLLVSGIAALVFCLLELLFPIDPGDRPKFARGEAFSVKLAISQYIRKVGYPPPGNAAEIMTALRGKNPLDFVFFKKAARRFNSRGEFLDPWKTPFRIDVSDPSFLRVYSCGENRIDDGAAESSDDIASWR